jgi:hypothetical protein
MIRSVFDERLFVGDAMDARDAQLLFDNQIGAVVDVAANEQPAQLPREIIYCRFPIIDGDGNSPDLLRLAVETVVKLIRGNCRTLVACSAGMSRSPSVAAAAISVVTDRSMDVCLQALIENGPHDVSPLL